MSVRRQCHTPGLHPKQPLPYSHRLCSRPAPPLPMSPRPAPHDTTPSAHPPTYHPCPLSFLADFKGTVVAVTHDRYFLDNVAGWILELDRGAGIPFEGNYSGARHEGAELLGEGQAGSECPRSGRGVIEGRRARSGCDVLSYTCW